LTCCGRSRSRLRPPKFAAASVEAAATFGWSGRMDDLQDWMRSTYQRRAQLGGGNFSVRTPVKEMISTTAVGAISAAS